jgi:hypothetical protein
MMTLICKMKFVRKLFYVRNETKWKGDLEALPVDGADGGGALETQSDTHVTCSQCDRIGRNFNIWKFFSWIGHNFDPLNICQVFKNSKPNWANFGGDFWTILVAFLQNFSVTQPGVDFTNPFRPELLKLVTGFSWQFIYNLVKIFQI